MWEIGLPRLRMNRRNFLQGLFRAASRFSRGPVAGVHRQHFFDPTGSNTIIIVHSDRKCEELEARLRLYRGFHSAEGLRGGVIEIQQRSKQLTMRVSMVLRLSAGRNAVSLEKESARATWNAEIDGHGSQSIVCLLYTSPSPRDKRQSRMPSSA